MKTRLTFLLLVFFFPVVTSKIFFTTRLDLRLVPRALAGALASGVLELLAPWSICWVWCGHVGSQGPWEDQGVKGGCNPRARGVTPARMAPLTSLFLGARLPPVRVPAFSVGTSAPTQHLLQRSVLPAGEPRLLDYLQPGQWRRVAATCEQPLAQAGCR